MSQHIWKCLETLADGWHVATEWTEGAGDDFAALRATYLKETGEQARWLSCRQGCGCRHEVLLRSPGELAAVCRCEPRDCEDFIVHADDVWLWQLNAGKFGRAVVELVARQRQPFILLAPTSRMLDAGSRELLAGARAGFFDLESHVRFTSSGALQPCRSPGELFQAFAPAATEAATDDEARRLFALLKALESESNYRKAPVTRVFQLYCLESQSRNNVARACRCAPSLITLRLKAIEKKLGRKPAELRTLSTQFEQIAESLTDANARRIDRTKAADGSDNDDED